MNGSRARFAVVAMGGALLLATGLGAAPRQGRTTGAQAKVKEMARSAVKPDAKAALAGAKRIPGRIGDAWSDPQNPIVKIWGGKRLDLWSLKKPRPITPPAPHNAAWVKTPVDRFILSGLEARKLIPSPQADRRSLIRRLYFDLLGLPPTPEEVKAFIADNAPNAYSKLVERLLASRHYGERWGRHWLDVVRYADTNGFERDEFRPNTYRYRDWVVRAFNEDKPYNQFIKEQLAGDEMVGSDKPQTQAEINRLIATGYMRLGQYDSTGSIFEEDKRGRDQLMADLVNTTGSAFLGLTVACANCHDHKYDPISQADHFRLRAFFAGVKYRDDIAAELPAEREAIDKQNAALDAQIKAAENHPESLHSVEEWKKQRKPHALMLAMTDTGASAPATAIFMQGDFQRPNGEVPPGFLSVLDPNPAPVQAPSSGHSTGRRTALANWIASPDNPYTARVMVNRLWQHHFGVGLVRTPNDFGYSGARPANQPLLDWLANEFVRSGWSVKHMQRLMVLSAAYRQASFVDPRRKAADPENLLLWRQNIHRHDAEALRNSMLAVSGLLLPVSDGPPLWPPVQQDLLDAQPSILETHSDEEARKRMEGWYAGPVEKTDARTLFLIQKRCLSVPFLQPFDLQDTSISCAARTNTTVAPQALTLLNNELTLRSARAFAARVMKEAGEDREKQIRRAVWLALSREPDKDEMKVALNLLAQHARQHAQHSKENTTDATKNDAKNAAGETPARMALTDLCRMLLNVNEFVYVD